MAIIYTYPEINQVEGEDLLLISDTSLYKRPTRSVTIDNLAAYIGTVVGVVQNLQSVLTVGNTYVSPDGYGTFTLNDIANNDGSIKFANTDEGWGYQISAEEGFNITDGHETNLMSIYSSGLSIRNGAQIMNIGTNALTATRNVYFPDASGTIALENVSEWYNVTGSRGLGNLLVKIGDYDNSGNGTFLSIDDADQSIIFTKGGVVESKFVFAATQDRDYTFPNADGTIALTSDIPTPGPSGSGTTNYTARWTSASTLGIGALYDNGTNVGVGTTSPSSRLEVVGSYAVVPLKVLRHGDYGNVINIGRNGVSETANIGYPADSTINLSTAGSERVRINASGNVGIGTTSPSHKLTVNAANNTTAVGIDFPSAHFDFSANSTSGYTSNFRLDDVGMDIGHDSTARSLNLQTGNLDRVTILGNGNVGIGTTSPLAKTHIKASNAGGDSAASGTLIVEQGSAPSIQLLSANSQTQTIKFADPQSSQIGRISYSHPSDAMFFVTNGAEKMRITNTGNVGIGTTSPSQKLTVEGNIELGTGGYIYGDTTTSYLRLSNALGSLLGYSNAYIGLGPSFVYNVGGSEKFRISSSSGNVGIGTTNPGSQLEISKDSDDGTNAPVLSLTNASTTLNNGANIGIIQFKNSDLSGGGPHIATIKGVANSLDERTTELAFSTGNVATTNEAMRITSSGNVGIGTTSPSTNLEIVTSNPSNGINLTTNTGNLWGVLLNTNSNDFPVGKLALKFGSNETASITARSNEMRIGGSQMNITFYTSSSEKFRVDTNGNVGIGTTSPSTKLHVQGAASGYLFRVQGTSTLNVYDPGAAAEIGVGSGSGDKLKLFSNDSLNNGITIDTSGNVGIGTTSPAYTLDVVSAGTATARLKSAGTGAISLRYENGSGFKSAAVVDNNGLYRLDATNISLNPTNNVGIGTTSPSRNLHVHADSGNAYLQLTQAATGTTSNDGFQISMGTAQVNFINRENGNMVFETNNTEKMRITNTGNVGIGTTSPGAKLSVNGNVKIEGTNSLLFGGSASIPSWAINHNGSDLLIDDQGGNIGSVLFNNSEGVALPRLTTTQINAISLPAQGLMAYNTTLNTICFYNGSSWQKVSHTSM